jgi:hypothetical protein
MKKTSFIFVLITIVWYSTINAQDWWNHETIPVMNVSMHPDTTPVPEWNYPTLFNWNFANISTPGINSATVGAMYFQDMYYLNKFNKTIIYRYEGGWQGPTSFIDSIYYEGSIRDLATDGQYLFGGDLTNTIYVFDADGITLGTLTLDGPAAVRGIAYTPEENGIYVCNFNDKITLYNAATGKVIRVLPRTDTLAGKYGLAYSSLTEEAPALWVWGQGTSADPYNNLWKLNPLTGEMLVKYRFGPLEIQTGQTSLSGIAGGAEVCVINQSSVLLLNYQNYALIGYRIGDALPVELISFAAQNVNNKVTLTWTTATEINNHGFEVQRSAADGNFHTIAFVNGAGTSAELHNYTFTDKILEAGKYTYRLRQVDFNGHYEYSKRVLVEVSHPSKYELMQNYPNPFNPNTTITFKLASDSRVSVKIINLIGQVVDVLVNGDMSAGTHSIKLDASKLTSGIYLYKLEATRENGEIFMAVRKMMLLK